MLFRFVNTDSNQLLSTLHLWSIYTTDSLTSFPHGYTTSIHHWRDYSFFHSDSLTCFSHWLYYTVFTLHKFLSASPILYFLITESSRSTQPIPHIVFGFLPTGELWSFEHVKTDDTHPTRVLVLKISNRGWTPVNNIIDYLHIHNNGWCTPPLPPYVYIG